MPKISLTDARVAALTPRKTAYDIRDSKLQGFGVRVLPSGRKHFFVHCQHREVRVWRIVGDASTTGVHEARLSATEMLAAIRRGETMPLRSPTRRSSRPSPRPCSSVTNGFGSRGPSM